MQTVTIWVTLVPWRPPDSGTDMDLPGLDLHELRGPRKGSWAVKVSGNWRVTFSCAERDMVRVDYEDYH